MTVDRKYERDIDVMLAEEFIINADFSRAFRALTRFANIEAEVVDVWVSKSDNLGESDLIVVLRDGNERRFALLIEDKVDAPLQTDQAERYRQRAERDRLRGVYDEYEVLLCAPDFYIGSRGDLVGFDRLISFEAIAAILRGLGDPRSEYRAHFLETAGTRRVNQWVRENDEETNSFWNMAYDMARNDFSELQMQRPNVAKGTTWITLRPSDLPTMPKRVYLLLKGDRGYIDLTFSNTNSLLFRPIMAHLLEPDMSVHQTAASAVVRLETPGFQITDGVEAGMPNVRSALHASSRLITFYRNARAVLDKAARDATPLP